MERVNIAAQTAIPLTLLHEEAKRVAEETIRKYANDVLEDHTEWTEPSADKSKHMEWMNSVRGTIWRIYSFVHWTTEAQNLEVHGAVWYWTGWALQVTTVTVVLLSICSLIAATNPIYFEEGEPAWNVVINAFAIAWFTLEYLIRLVCAEKWFKFVVKLLSIIDLLTFLPYYIELIVGATLGTSNLRIRTLYILRVIRLLRLFKLIKYSETLKCVVASLRISGQGFVLLLAALMVNLIFFSFCMYYAEQSECFYDSVDRVWVYTSTNTTSPFQSVYETFYWNIITVTTIGYGDVVPITIAGKVVAGLTAVSGLLLLTFPISVFSLNFTIKYQELVLRLETEKVMARMATAEMKPKSTREMLLVLTELSRQLHKQQVECARRQVEIEERLREFTNVLHEDVPVVSVDLATGLWQRASAKKPSSWSVRPGAGRGKGSTSALVKKDGSNGSDGSIAESRNTPENVISDFDINNNNEK